MGLSFNIAWRFLKSSKGQTFLIALGIAIGVSVQIFIGSLIQGLQIDLVDTTIGSQPQISLSSTNDDKKIEDYELLLEEIETVDPSIQYLSAVVDGQALVTIDESNYNVLVRGLDFEAAEGIYKVEASLVEGMLPDETNEVLVGYEFAKDTDLVIGDSFEAFTGPESTTSFKVTGIFDLEVANLNRSWVLSTIDTAQEVFGLDDAVTGIEMQVEDVFLADSIAQAIADTLDATLEVDNWKDQNQALLSGLNGQSVSSYMIQIFVMVSVLLGIASVLAITVVQKSKQIGILKAMGIRDKAASRIFLIQGLLLGFAGAILGIVLGLGLAFLFTKFALNPDGSPVVPLFISPGFIAFSAAFAILVSMGAALIPARSSSKLNPIEVIRNA